MEMDYIRPDESFAAEMGRWKPTKNKRLLTAVAHMDPTDAISAVYDTASDVLKHSNCPDCRESALNLTSFENSNSVENQQSQKGNFYTVGIIQPKKNNP